MTISFGLNDTMRKAKRKPRLKKSPTELFKRMQMYAPTCAVITPALFLDGRLE